MPGLFFCLSTIFNLYHISSGENVNKYENAKESILCLRAALCYKPTGTPVWGVEGEKYEGNQSKIV